MNAKRIAMYTSPDTDALVAAWLAERYLPVREPAEVFVVPRGCPPGRLAAYDWVVRPGAQALVAAGPTPTRETFGERYARSATGRIWSHLLGLGRPVAHLVDLVDAVHDRAQCRVVPDASGKSHDEELYGLICEAKSRSPDHMTLYHAVRAWLDTYAAGIAPVVTAPVDREWADRHLPREPATYALVLEAPARGVVLIGRTGRLGRMEVRPGFYVYTGSACKSGGLRDRLMWHLTPATQVKAKWQVDFLRLRCSVVEVWYTTTPLTTAPLTRECMWAKCIREMPGATVPVPRFGSTDCRCLAHLAYFAARPSFRLFRARAARPPLSCHAERVVLD